MNESIRKNASSKRLSYRKAGAFADKLDVNAMYYLYSFSQTDLSFFCIYSVAYILSKKQIIKKILSGERKNTDSILEIVTHITQEFTSNQKNSSQTKLKNKSSIRNRKPHKIEKLFRFYDCIQASLFHKAAALVSLPIV